MGLVVGERPLATKTRYLRLSTSFSELEPRSLHARSHLYSSFSPAYYLSPLPGKVFSEEGRTTSLLPRYPEEHETMIHSVNDEVLTMNSSILMILPGGGGAGRRMVRKYSMTYGLSKQNPSSAAPPRSCIGKSIEKRPLLKT